MFVYYKGAATKNVWNVKCEYKNVSDEEAIELLETGEYFTDPRDIDKPKETPKPSKTQESHEVVKEQKPTKRRARKNAKKSDS